VARRSGGIGGVISLEYLLLGGRGMSVAQHVVTRLVDDLDGSDAVARVPFSLDGLGFEIDLSAEHLAELRAVLEPFVAAARRVSGGSRSSGARSVAAGAEAVAPAGESGDRTAVRRRGRRADGRPVGGGSAKIDERPIVVQATSREQMTSREAPSREQPAPVQEAVPGPVPTSRPERQRRPLVVDPFNQDVRLV
jgi:hypothetical protein